MNDIVSQGSDKRWGVYPMFPVVGEDFNIWMMRDTGQLLLLKKHLDHVLYPWDGHSWDIFIADEMKPAGVITDLFQPMTSGNIGIVSKPKGDVKSYIFPVVGQDVCFGGKQGVYKVWKIYINSGEPEYCFLKRSYEEDPLVIRGYLKRSESYIL